MVTEPLVSVIMPACNAAPFIRETLASVLEQSYRELEVIVVDDGSEDETRQIAERAARKDRRVRLLHEPNRGVAAARNLGIEQSSGEYVAPIDADDIWYRDKIEKQLACVRNADPSVGLVYAWQVYIDKDGSPIRAADQWDMEGFVYNTLILRNFVGCGSIALMTRACLDSVGGYNTRLREQGAEGCEDWELYLRIAERYRVRVVSDYLVGHRRTHNSMSSNRSSMSLSRMMVINEVEQRHPEIPGKVFRWSKSHLRVRDLSSYYANGDYLSALLCAFRNCRLDPVAVLAYASERFMSLTARILKTLRVPSPSVLLTGRPLPPDFNDPAGWRKVASVTFPELEKAPVMLKVFKPYRRLLLGRLRWTMESSNQGTSSSTQS